MWVWQSQECAGTSKMTGVDGCAALPRYGRAMSWSLYGAYLVFVALLVIAPGPDTLVVLKNSLAGGRLAGVVACVGVTTGCILQGTAAALGVGALIVRSQPVFDTVRVAGVIYLCWLGIQALRSAFASIRLLASGTRSG